MALADDAAGTEGAAKCAVGAGGAVAKAGPTALQKTCSEPSVLAAPKIQRIFNLLLFASLAAICLISINVGVYELLSLVGLAQKRIGWHEGAPRLLLKNHLLHPQV